MRNAGILKSQLFIILVFVFLLGLITIAVASPPGEDELKQLAAQYSPTDKLTLSAFGGTVQDDFNRAGGTNRLTPLNFLTGSAATVGPYFLYGVLKDISYNYGFDADYALGTQVTLFAEYSRDLPPPEEVN
jgi:hypothetical protein